MGNKIHPTAIIEDGAVIGQDVTVEPYAIIKGNVTIGDRVVVKSHAYIDGYTTIGADSVIWPGASIGTRPQDLKYRGEKTFVEIGERCQIREFVTINSSCNEGSVVRVGNDCLIMAYCHVAHNCEVGHHVIMANGAMLAGHVTVEDYAIIGGMTPIHQFSKVGKYAMVGGFSRVPRDVPPFTIGAGSPYELGGLNLVGLKRHGIAIDNRRRLSHCFKWTYRANLTLEEALKKIEQEVERDDYVDHWLSFCRESKRGLIGLNIAKESRETQADDLES